MLTYVQYAPLPRVTFPAITLVKIGFREKVVPVRVAPPIFLCALPAACLSKIGFWEMIVFASCHSTR